MAMRIPDSGYHFAFFNYPAHGHVNPTLPVVAELVRRGHRVTYVVAGQFADAVRAAGAVPISYDSQVPKSWDTVAIPETITPDVVAEAARAHAVEGFAPLEVAHAAFDDDRPDAVLYDAFGYPAGRLLSRKWDIPAALSCTTFAANEHFSPYAAMADQLPAPDPGHPAIHAARDLVSAVLAEHGMTESPEEFAAAREDLHLIFVPRWFQPGAETFDGRFDFVGPCLGPRPGTWTPPGGRPVLLITMGSFGYENQLAFFSHCIEAFADTRWHVLMTIGRLVRLAELGPLPANFEVHTWVPQLAALRHATCFVSHAGMGSAMESLAAGVPPLVVPRSPEQELVAGRLTELGLGWRLSPGDVSARSLRTAVAGLAADAETSRRVRGARDRIAAAQGPSRAADRIEAMVTRPRERLAAPAQPSSAR
jgi:MGT family glycosyltransferase